MIEFHNVTKRYNNTFTALNNVSFKVNAGEVFGIIGESGAGKSTLLRIISHLETYDSGQVLVDGFEMSSLSKKVLKAKRRDIGVIFQNYNLLKNRSVYDNIALPLKLNKSMNPEAIQKVLEFTKLTDKKDAYPKQLSGGERQRVAIARALVTNPKILVCDEPTSALDPKTTTDILSVLKSINEMFGTTIVIVTHELEVAKAICKRVAIFEKGNLCDTVDVKNVDLTQVSSYVDQAKAVLSL